MGHWDLTTLVERIMIYSILQKFDFAHQETKVKLNNIYNGHWTGSQFWRLGCEELGNRSIKIMYDLPWATHR